MKHALLPSLLSSPAMTAIVEPMRQASAAEPAQTPPGAGTQALSRFATPNASPMEGHTCRLTERHSGLSPSVATDQDITSAPAVGRGFGGGFGGFRGPGPAIPPRTSFTFTVLPHSYMAFAVR